jgi:monoterpene epsilon-lactone hydrolase
MTDRAQERLDWETLAMAEPLPDGTVIADLTLGGVACEAVTCGPVQGRLLLLHGGGYVSGSPRTHRKLAAWLAQIARLQVITPDYRLAPEHPFPAGLDDALTVWQALRAGPGPLALAGDSAGGGLALALMLAIKERGLMQPDSAALLSPWADLTGQGPSLSVRADKETIITLDGLNGAARDYAGEKDLRHPQISPVFADLTGLPPLLIDVAGDEILLGDAALIAAHAQAVGVVTDFRVWPGLWHVWHHAAGQEPAAEAALARIAQFIDSHRRPV